MCGLLAKWTGMAMILKPRPVCKRNKAKQEAYTLNGIMPRPWQFHQRVVISKPRTCTLPPL